MIAAIDVYAQLLRAHGDGGGSCSFLRSAGGGRTPLPIGRWIGRADGADERALARLRSPVLDVGCGPGRHLGALAQRGVFGLGVDLCPTAVRLARGWGAHAIVGSIFGEVPNPGMWRSALLLDGNIGIGGRPAALLTRIVELLAPDGTILVELAPPKRKTASRRLRIVTASEASEWFDWAEVSTDAIAALARRANLRVDEVWSDLDRWFALLATRQADGAAAPFSLPRSSRPAHRCLSPSCDDAATPSSRRRATASWMTANSTRHSLAKWPRSER